MFWTRICWGLWKITAGIPIFRAYGPAGLELRFHTHVPIFPAGLDNLHCGRGLGRNVVSNAHHAGHFPDDMG
jgi:hypothetical protein